MAACDGRLAGACDSRATFLRLPTGNFTDSADWLRLGRLHRRGTLA